MTGSSGDLVAVEVVAVVVVVVGVVLVVVVVALVVTVVSVGLFMVRDMEIVEVVWLR